MMTIDTSGAECHPALPGVWQGARLNPLVVEVLDPLQCPRQRWLKSDQGLF